MIKVGNNTYRNLEEQVQKNKEDIARHWEVDRVLADFGINILGVIPRNPHVPEQVGTTFGDAYLVGLEAPYDVWVWTRPNPDIGEYNPYWLRLGPIFVQGPEGPKGDEGPQGIPGKNVKWYFGGNPEAVYKPNAGDSFLQTAGDTIGNVYIYSGGRWSLTGNIRGAQGLRGPQGSVGPQGPRGEKGAQGPAGPSIAAISIIGTLGSASQLPTPSEANSSKGYLVGSTSAGWTIYANLTGTWINLGGWNQGTMVTDYSGQPVDTFDIKQCLRAPTEEPTGENVIYQWEYVLPRYNEHQKNNATNAFFYLLKNPESISKTSTSTAAIPVPLYGTNRRAGQLYGRVNSNWYPLGLAYTDLVEGDAYNDPNILINLQTLKNFAGEIANINDQMNSITKYYPASIILRNKADGRFHFTVLTPYDSIGNYSSVKGIFVADEDYSLYAIKDMWMRGGAYTTATSNKIQAFGHSLISGLSNNATCTLIFDPTEISSEWLWDEVDTTTMQLRIGETVTKKTIQVTTNQEVFDNQEGTDIYLLEYYQPYEEQ